MKSTPATTEFWNFGKFNRFKDNLRKNYQIYGKFSVNCANEMCSQWLMVKRFALFYSAHLNIDSVIIIGFRHLSVKRKRKRLSKIPKKQLNFMAKAVWLSFYAFLLKFHWENQVNCYLFQLSWNMSTFMKLLFNLICFYWKNGLLLHKIITALK